MADSDSPVGPEGWKSASGSLKRTILICIGIVCVALGVLGIFLPVLPTTPFLLVAAVCLERGSERLHRWLLDHRVLGLYVRNYVEKRGMKVRQKVFTIAFIWLTIGLTVWLVLEVLWVRILILAIAATVTVHLLLIKTCAAEASDTGTDAR